MDQFYIYLFGALLAFVGLVVLSLFIHFQRARRQFAEKYVVVQVRVPKESESGPIVAEQIYATLHGIESKFSFLEVLRGYTAQHVSFEIASIGRRIKFFVAFPESLRNLVEGQIYANYPDVEIEDCPDYSRIKGNLQAFGVELYTDEPDIYPIKRYPQFEDKLTRVAVDPLAGITSALVKFDDPDDQAWIQIVTAPLADRWRKVFTNCARLLNSSLFGKFETIAKWYARAFSTRKTWLRVLFFPLYWFFGLQSLFFSAGIDFSGAPRQGSHTNDELTSSSHDRETVIGAVIDKVIRPLFSVNIRVVYLSKKTTRARANVKLKEIAGAFKQFNLPHLNRLEIRQFFEGPSIIKTYNKRILRDPFVLNNEELATIYHMPSLTVKTPTIYWVSSKKLEPPSDLPEGNNAEGVTDLGETDYRGHRKVFGIRTEDRRRHVYVIGKTGMGKSTLLENMIFSDINAGRGVGVIDPHGDLAESVLNFVPKSRVNDVVLIDPSDPEFAVAFNMLENVDPALNSIVASGLVGIFKKIYADSWGPRLEHILRNTILALLEYPNTTMLGITRILQDAKFRSQVVKKIEDPVVKSFWVDEFERMQDRIRIEAISPIQNKVGQFLSSQTIRNIVGQPKSTVDLRFFMDKGKIVIINLSKGKIGEDNSALLGSMFITKFQLDAMSRAHLPEKERRDFYLYVDEFQNFATDSFATILSEARKYRLSLTMANQYIAQMPDEVKDAVFGNVGSLLTFQVGYDDAEYISQQFGEEVLPGDLVSLSKYTAYMRLLVDGMPTKTFSLRTLPPPSLDLEEGHIDKVRRVSNERYGKKKDIIADKIKRWSVSNSEVSTNKPKYDKKNPNG